VPQLAQGVHLLPPGCTEDFQSVLACTRSAARRTFSCLHSLKGEEDFISFSPALAQSRGGLYLACTRSKSRRTFPLSRLHSLNGEEDFFLPTLAQSRGGLYLFLACTRSKSRRTLSLSRLKTHESAEVFTPHWCLRSPKDDEVF